MTLDAIARRALDRARMREMSIVARCLREAREAVGSPTHRANAYGTVNHSMRRQYDAAVQRELHRRLKRAGVHVEGA